MTRGAGAGAGERGNLTSGSEMDALSGIIGVVGSSSPLDVMILESFGISPCFFKCCSASLIRVSYLPFVPPPVQPAAFRVASVTALCPGQELDVGLNCTECKNASSFFISSFLILFFYYSLFQLFPYFLFPDDCSNTASAGDDILGMYNNGSTAAYDAEVRLELLELYSIKID